MPPAVGLEAPSASAESLPAVDVYRRPVCLADVKGGGAASASSPPSAAAFAARVSEALSTGTAAASAAFAAQTGGNHIAVRRGGADGQAPTAATHVGVPATALPQNDVAGFNPATVMSVESLARASPHWLQQFAVINKAGEGNVKLNIENGRYDVIGPNFTSLLHRNIFASGKWMYEVAMQSEGLVQIGWSNPHDAVDWTPQLGVGDFLHSVAYDGYRRKVWKGSTVSAADTAASAASTDGSTDSGPAAPSGATAAAASPSEAPAATTVAAAATAPPASSSSPPLLQSDVYAVPSWNDGDIITCCADLDAGVATFYANGELTVRTRIPSVATAPADDSDSLPYYLLSAGITVGRLERVNINFGDAPFAYPQPGFSGVSWLRAGDLTDSGERAEEEKKEEASSTSPQQLPAFIRAHVAAEAAVAVAQTAGSVGVPARNIALARLISGLDAAAARLFASAVVQVLLRPYVAAAADDDGGANPFGPVDEASAPAVDHAARAALDVLVPALAAMADDPPRALRELMCEFGFAARGLCFEAPSRRVANRRARAALRLAAHVCTAHAATTPLMTLWPSTADEQLDRDLAPFTKPRYASAEVLEELVPEIELNDPLRTPGLAERAREIGDDLYKGVQPFREAVLQPLVEEKPWLIAQYINVVANRQDAAATSGTMLFGLLAGCVVRHAARLSDDQLVQVYANRASLASERALKVEPRRLGGSVGTVQRRTGVSIPRAPLDDHTVNALLVSLTWLCHATARRHVPSVIKTVFELQRTVEELKRAEDSADPGTLIERITNLTRSAVLMRGRVAHESLVNTLLEYTRVIARVMTYFDRKVTLATVKRDKNDHATTFDVAEADAVNALDAGLRLTTMKPTDAMVDYLLLPTGFPTAVSLIFQMFRRSMPVGFAERMLQSMPGLARAALHGAINPICDPSDTAELLLQMACLVLDPPGPSMESYSAALVASVRPDDIAIVLARGFTQLQNDMAWSTSISLVSSVAAGTSLAWQRGSDGSTSGWLMWNNEPDSADLAVSPPPDLPVRDLMRAGVRMLDSAQAARDFADAAGTFSEEEISARKARSLVDGFQALLTRTSWLMAEFGLSAQSELNGRGTPEVRGRMSVIFDLMQRSVQAIEFFLWAAGDMLLTEAETNEASPGASAPILVQQTVECLTLILRQYGDPESMMFKIAKAPSREARALYPWRLIGPTLGALLEVLRPDSRDSGATGAPEFAPWKRVFHRMLTSPRCVWDVAHIEHARAALNLPALIADKKALAPQSKLDLLQSDAWLQQLRELYEQQLSNSTSPSAANKKRRAKLAAENELAAIGKAFSTASLDEIDDGQLCTICYVDPQNVKFHPCGHQSCRVCIERQLSGGLKRCFFCNAPVERVEDLPTAPKTPMSATLGGRQGSSAALAALGAAGTPTSATMHGMFPPIENDLPAAPREDSDNGLHTTSGGPGSGALA